MKSLNIDSADPNTIMHEISLFFQNNDDNYIHVFSYLKPDMIVGRTQDLKRLMRHLKTPD